MQKPVLAAIAIFAATAILPAYGGLNPHSAPLSQTGLDADCMVETQEMDWQLAGLAAEGGSIRIDADSAALFDSQIVIEPSVDGTQETENSFVNCIDLGM